MLFDARTIPIDAIIDTDICIVGSGPAGMTIAQELIGQDLRVCVLESGGLEPDESTQRLATGQTDGDFYTPFHQILRRQCGGTANAWDIEITPTQRGVRYVPLDPIDFETRDWIPHSGWPIDRTTLDPYYERAHRVCQIGAFAYDPESWATPHTPPLPLNPDRVVTSMFQFGASDVFTQDCRDRIKQSRNVTLYLNANVLELETNDTASRVTAVRVGCLSKGEAGSSFRVVAKRVILATGGVENARLLLVSNRVQATGLGNHYDQVGRYFMDHPLIRTGLFFPSDRTLFQHTALYDWRWVHQTLVMGKLTLAEATLRREQLLHSCAILFPRYPVYQSDAVTALKRLLGETERSILSPGIWEDVQQVATEWPDILQAAYRRLRKPSSPKAADLSIGGWSRLPRQIRKLGCFEIFSPTEQAPDPDNRLTLSEWRDPFGYQKAKLHWRWREADIRSIKRTQEILADELAAAGLGWLEIARHEELPQLLSPGMHHPIGGTRMHVSPRHGVVDANCAVHGVPNLFIAGSSVFPTGGFANPTLTVVAIALRVADAVKHSLQNDATVVPRLPLRISGTKDARIGEIC